MEGKHTPYYELTEYEFSFDIDYFPDVIFSKQTILCASKEHRDHLKQIVKVLNDSPALLEQVEKLKKENERLSKREHEVNRLYCENEQYKNEVEKLKAREKELIEALHKMQKWQPDNKTNWERYANDIINDILTSIKQTT